MLTTPIYLHDIMLIPCVISVFFFFLKQIVTVLICEALWIKSFKDYMMTFVLLFFCFNFSVISKLLFSHKVTWHAHIFTTYRFHKSCIMPCSVTVNVFINCVKMIPYLLTQTYRTCTHYSLHTDSITSEWCCVNFNIWVDNFPCENTM